MEKFSQIQKLLENLDGYLVPHNDAHQSEYIAECDERLAFISNFDGSAGLALILKEKAILWTDSRYHIQAQKQLQKPWEMKKAEESQWFNYIVDNLPKNSKIGFDPNLLTAQTVEMRQQFFQQRQIQFIPVQDNLIDKIWINRPNRPTDKIFIHEKEFCGLHTCEKLKIIKQKVQEKQCNFFLTSKLDEIAWTLNLRGSDIEFNPVFFSYLIIDFTQDKGILFINPQKVDQLTKNYLQNECKIEIQPYDQIQNWLSEFKNGKILLSKGSLNYKTFQQINDQSNFCDSQNIIDLIKEVKTQREMDGMRECHVYDGVALVQFLSWLENEILINNQRIDEYQASQKAAYFRSQQKYNVGLSFETISSTGANAAIIHYKPLENQCSVINPDQIYLCDSGGQYKCGTTDVTRTIHMKTSTQEEKKAYTLVLLGNLGIEQCVWPKTQVKTGTDFDIIARQKLNENNMDFGHGTGHGVGYYLNVHEGPNGISKYRNQPFEKGHIVSDEPGYYKEGSFGVRIENLIMCIEKDENLSFLNLTVCPYDRNLIDLSLCTQVEIKFINDYHERCWKELSPLLEEKNDQVALKWLQKHTQPL